MFVQVLVIFLHWIDTLVLKTEGNTYRRCATSPFPLRGNTNARLQGHVGILCIFSKEVPKGVAVAEGFLVPLLRSIKTRTVSRQHVFLAPLEGLLLHQQSHALEVHKLTQLQSNTKQNERTGTTA